MELVGPPSPHFIPGYTGFCPQKWARFGDTYGTTTHKIILDPGINHAPKLVLASQKPDPDQAFRPSKKDIKIVNGRATTRDTIYGHPFIPGYEGFIPQEHFQFGQRFPVQATEALAGFEGSQMRNHDAYAELIQLVQLQNGKWNPKSLSDKKKTTAQVILPLDPVRPECGQIVEKDEGQCIVAESPYFMDNTNPDKKFILGYAGHIPCASDAIGKSSLPSTNQALCSFTDRYRKRFSTEFSPIKLKQDETPTFEQPFCLYRDDVGQLPNYGGQVPGFIFKVGKTYGDATKGAKKYLMGEVD